MPLLNIYDEAFLKKLLTALDHLLFLQKAQSWMFDRDLNTPLTWQSLTLWRYIIVCIIIFWWTTVECWLWKRQKLLKKLVFKIKKKILKSFVKYWGVIFTHVSIQFSLIIKFTAQKIKFFIKDFFSKCHQICRKLWIWPHLLNKFLMENFIFWAVNCTNAYRKQIFKSWSYKTLKKD